MRLSITSILLLSSCLMSAASAQDYALSPDGASVVRLLPNSSVIADSFTTPLASYGYTTTTGNTGSLSIQSFISSPAYSAGYVSATTGGGHFEALYSYGSALPSGTSLKWIQVVTANTPPGSTTSPFLDIGPTKDCHSPAPFYGCMNENLIPSIPAGQINFYDFSLRDSSQFSTAYPINWQANLYPVLVKGNALTIENGISWGWSMKKATVGTVAGTFTNPSPGSATVSGVGTDSFSWGVGSPDQSELIFTGADFDTKPKTPFKLGTITFHNGTITSDSGADSVDFGAALNFTNIPEKNFSLNSSFTLVNTVNTDDPEASADYVVLGDYGYTFHVLEGDTATADLYVTLNPTLTAPTGMYAQDSGVWTGTIYTDAGYTLTVLGFQNPSSGGFIDSACAPTNANDVCYINATTDTNVAIDALGGTNTLQLGGTTDFSFGAGLIGTTYANFNTFIKADASNITLTGTATQNADWYILAGTLTASGGHSIADTAQISIADGATFALADSETIGSLTGLGTTGLADSTLTLAAGGNYGGVISGTGNVVLTGGTLFLSGTNTFSGITTISGGTLALSESGSLAASQSIVDNGTFDISGAFSAVPITTLSGNGMVSLGAQTLVLTAASHTFSGVIGGDGGFAITGGTEVLTGANTYTGTTTIVAGTLQIGSGGTTGSIASQLVVSDGRLIFNRSDVFTFSGVISGTGALTQAGSGTLVLNGVNTDTGLTTVAAGRLEVGDANHATASLAGPVTVANRATLSGHGTIAGSVANTAGGTVAPGGSIGTLTVGSYTQSSSSTLAVEVAPTMASLLNVTGAASLNGTLSAAFDAGTYTPAILPILKAASITGTFSTFSATGTNADWVYGVYYAPTNREVDIVVSPKSAGQIYGDLVTAGLDYATALNVTAFDHAAFGGCTSYVNNTVGLAADCSSWSFWAHGFGGTEHTDAGNGATAFTTHNWGFMGGVDRSFSNSASLNIAAAYSSGSLGVSGANAKADTNEYFVSLAGHAPWAVAVLDADVFYMAGDADISRASGFGSTIQSTVTNTTIGFSAQISHPLLNGDVVPLVRATYAHLSYGPLVETGGGGLDLAGLHGSSDLRRYDFGIMLNHTFTTSNGAVLWPHLLAAFEAVNTDSASPEVAMRLANSLNTDFIAPSPGADTSAALVRLGLMAQFSTMWSVDAGIEGRFSGNQQQAFFHLDAAYHF